MKHQAEKCLGFYIPTVMFGHSKCSFEHLLLPQNKMYIYITCCYVIIIC